MGSLECHVNKRAGVSVGLGDRTVLSVGGILQLLLLLLLLYRDQGISYYTHTQTHTAHRYLLPQSSSLVAFDLNFAYCVTLKMSCCVSRVPSSKGRNKQTKRNNNFLLLVFLSSTSKVNQQKMIAQFFSKNHRPDRRKRKQSQTHSTQELQVRVFRRPLFN